METKYILSYFPARALGESIRLLLTYGDIEFEDRRIPIQEWHQYKYSTPGGQVPILQIGDKILHQSVAISRYLGKQLKLAGENDWQSMEIDMVVETLHDFRSKVAAAFYDPYDVSRNRQYEILKTKTIPFYLEKLEEIARKNQAHLALKKLTWADFVLTGMGDYLSMICGQDIFANCPNLKAIVDYVKDLPQIKAWYEKCPKTRF